MLISKETLIGAAALGAGAVAAKVVQNKLVGRFLPTTTPIQRNLITMAAGFFTPQVVRGPIGTGLGAGMIAASVAGIVDPYLQNAGLTGGVGQVLMGQATASATPVPLMGASDIFSAPVNDYTSEGSGEMSY